MSKIDSHPIGTLLDDVERIAREVREGPIAEFKVVPLKRDVPVTPTKPPQLTVPVGTVRPPSLRALSVGISPPGPGASAGMTVASALVSRSRIDALVRWLRRLA